MCPILSTKGWCVCVDFISNQTGATSDSTVKLADLGFLKDCLIGVASAWLE